jgi:multiple sugar transport system substrate-binding protein
MFRHVELASLATVRGAWYRGLSASLEESEDPVNRWVRGGGAVVVTALAAAGLAACGSSGSSSSGDGSANSINLMVAAYSDNTKGEWQQIIKDFEAKNPKVNIKLDVESWDDINNVITTHVQSHNPPDILNIDAYASYATAGLLYPAKEVTSPQLMSDFEPSFAKNATIGNTQWGLPFIASARALFYNKDLFAKAGISNPPKTWADLETDAKKIKSVGAIGYGMPLGAEEAQGESAIWFGGAGGGYGDVKKLTVDSPQNVEGATEMQKIIKSGVTEPNPGATNRDPLLNVFIQGQIGMEVSLPQTVVQIRQKNPKLNYGIAPIPTKDGSPFTLGVADHFMAFKNNVDKRPAIKAFFDYFYSAPVYTKWVAAEGFLPVTKSGVAQMGSNKDIKPFLDLLPDAKFYPAANPKWPVAQDALRSQMGTLAQGAKPAELLAQIQAKVGQ